MHIDDDVLARKIEIWMGNLRHPDAARRLQAAANLCRVGAAEAVPGLIDCLHDENVHVRKMAALGLGEIGEPIGLVVPVLVQALADADAGVQRRVAVALAEIASAKLAALPLLHCGLSHPDARVRVKVAEVVALLEAPRSAAA
jgi:HEAT repeat protein